MESIACNLILTQHVTAANVLHPEIGLFLIIYPRLLFYQIIFLDTDVYFFKAMLNHLQFELHVYNLA